MSVKQNVAPVCDGRRLAQTPLQRRPILTSLVSDCGAGWAGKMDDFEMLEADFAAPFLEIGGRIVERVAEFDQHV